MKNFEKIKQMTVDEMAEELECFQDTNSKCDFCIYYKKVEKQGELPYLTYYECINNDDIECIDGIKEWLLQEVEE